MFVSPMLLQKADLEKDTYLQNNEAFTTELKADGIRLIYSHWNGQTKLYSRHGNELTQFKHLGNLDLPSNTILDGELISPDSQGRPDFDNLMQNFHSSKIQYPLQIIFFDVIYYNGKNVTHLSLLERKKILNDLIPEKDQNFVQSQWILGNAASYFKAIKQYDLEGIVIKRADSKYTISRRSQDWKKIINYKYLSNVCIYGLRRKEFGALLSFENGQSAGMIEFMNKEDRIKLYSHARKYKKKETDDLIFFDKPLSCEVRFRNFTKNGKLRIPTVNSWTS